MLRLSPAQTKTLEHSALRPTLPTLIVEMRACFPRASDRLQPESLDKFVERMYAHLLALGVHTGAGLVEGVALSLMYGEKFWEALWCRDVWSVKALSADEKVRLLWRRVSRQYVFSAQDRG